MKSRRGETPKTFFRSDRYYTIGSDWYFSTREGNNVGPFRTRQAAAQAVVKYVDGLKQHRNSQVYSRTLANDAWSNTNFI